MAPDVFLARRFAVVCGVVLAASACGSDAASPPTTDAPQVATVAPSPPPPTPPPTTPAAPPGPTEPVPTAGVAASPPDELLVPGLPALDGAVRTYQWPADRRATRRDFDALAEALGVTGDVSDEVYGAEGGWTLDGDNLELMMDGGVEGAWSYSGPPPFAWPSESEPWPTIETGEPVTLAPPPMPATAPGAPLPDNYPSPEQAQERAREIVTRLGFDPAAFEWRTGERNFAAGVEAWWVIGGDVAPVKLDFGFGPEGLLLFASGQMIAPRAGPDVDRIGSPAAEERLRAEIDRTRGQPTPMGHILVGGVVVPGDRDARVVLAGPRAPEETTAPAQASPAPVTTAPVPTVPPDMIGRIIEVEASWQVVRDDSGTRLLPAYTFIEATGMHYTVSAAP